MNNIMFDIETLGKKRGCPVLSIAAVQFDLQTGNVGDTFYERMSCDAALTYGLPEISTLEWWDKQSSEARDAAFNGTRPPSVLPLNCEPFCNALAVGAVFLGAMGRSLISPFWRAGLTALIRWLMPRGTTSTRGSFGILPTCAHW